MIDHNFLVMKRYDQNLWTYLQQQSCDFGLFERIELAIKIVKEVEIVHKLNIAHRDIKPLNIMLDDTKQPVLVDFGIAEWRSELTFGDPKGTPGFTAPEQLLGEKQILEVDMFSLGKVLILTLFHWKVGWQILLCSKKFIDSKRLKPLTDLLETIARMLRVISATS